MKLITLSLYNRIDYTKQVLNALTKCHGVKDYVIIPIIDRTDFGFDFQQTFIELLYEYAKEGSLRIDNPRCHDRNVGCNRNIYTCFNIGFKFTDFLIHIEDDIILAPDALKYFEWANEKYRDDKTVFSVDAYNNEAHLTTPDNKQVNRSQSFKPWGWATWIDRWNDVKNRWQYDYGPRPDFPTGGGWDVCVKKVLRGDRYRIYPSLSRCLNIGEVGVHTPNKEWHWNKHKINWDLSLYQKDEFEFYEKKHDSL